MKEEYKLALTAGGLLLVETIDVAKRYRENPNWEKIRQEVANGSVLRKTRETSRLRYFLEIKRRLKRALPFEMEEIASGNPYVNHILFVLCCRYYRLLGDFVREVVLDKLSIGQMYLGLDDYYHFWEGKKLTHPELEFLSSSTMLKIRQVVFKMLREGGLISTRKENKILRPEIPKALLNKYREAGDAEALEYLLQRNVDR